MASFSLYADLLSIPWKPGGRDRDGIDCVGLFLEMQRRMGRTVPAYGSDEGVLAIARESWERVEDPQPGDAVLLRSSKPAWHIGTVTKRGVMIHAKEGAGVVVERYDAPQYARRVEGIYKLRRK